MQPILPGSLERRVCKASANVGEGNREVSVGARRGQLVLIVKLQRLKLTEKYRPRGYAILSKFPTHPQR